MQGPLKIPIAPSFMLSCYLVGLHLLAMLSLLLLIFVSGLSLAWVLLGLMVLLIHAYISWRRYQHDYRTDKPVEVHFVEKKWLLWRDDEIQQLNLKAATVWPCLVVMHFKTVGSAKWQRFLVFSDSCSEDQFRHLRVRLKNHKSYLVPKA